MPVSRRTQFRVSLFMAVALFVLAGQESSAQDWPGWRGADRSDRSSETGLLQEWPKEGPTKKWTNDQAGIGYAGFSVVQGRLYTMGQDDENEFALCLDAETGKEIWRKAVSDSYSNDWGSGPRGTPTVEGDHIYCLFADGTLASMKSANGEIVWTRRMQDLGGTIPSWGYSESPLVDGDLVICTPGGDQGAIAALNRTTGETVWQSRDVGVNAHYSSVIAMEINGTKQYVQLLVNRVVGINPADGALLWESKWGGNVAVIPTPVNVNGDVYITSGYKAGSKLVHVGKDNVAVDVWEDEKMVNHHGGVILIGEHLYGHSDKNGFICQNVSDGVPAWVNADIGKGCVTWADGRFYYVEESTGNVLLLEANSQKLTLRGKFKMEPQTQQRSAKGAVWVHPVISGGKLFVRDQELIHCYDIAK